MLHKTAEVLCSPLTQTEIRCRLAGQCLAAMLFFLFFYNCLVGCLSMIVWAPAVLVVLCVCVLYLHLFKAIEHVSHGKAL